MLLKMRGKTSERLHAPFISDNEIREHVFNLLKQSEGALDHIATDADSKPASEALLDKINFQESAPVLDKCFDDAVQFVKETKKASISSIQRKFKLGYGRAANIMEEMETKGIVGKRESQNGNRAVLV